MNAMFVSPSANNSFEWPTPKFGAGPIVCYSVHLFLLIYVT